MEIFREFTFDAAHRLENLPEGHKCARLHGHTYRLRVYVSGPVDTRVGWIVDFAQIKAAAAPVIEQVDHRLLNEIDGLDQPTTERLCVWLWDRLKPALPGLARIELWENTTSGCVYAGEPVRET